MIMIRYPKASANFAALAAALFCAATATAGQQNPGQGPAAAAAAAPAVSMSHAAQQPADENNNSDESVSAQDEVKLTGKFAALARAKGLDKDPRVKQAIAMFTDKILADAYKDYFMRQITPSEAEISAYYNKHKSDYNLYSLSHILVKFEKDPSNLPAEQAKKIEAQAFNKAQAIEARLKAGADFHELAAQLSDDANSRIDGGRVPETMARFLAPAFKPEILAAKQGDITPPLKSSFGYHIIMVEGVVPSDMARNRADVINDIREGKLAEKQISLTSSK
ncbi:peptidylprolyl isomerase [Burkholderia glumae]|nr:peptidylprolyl isomerase [Burkholderia glumae]PJO20883.1 peptidylprolyl isomerase [Burkholderia glumae AU6208]NVE24618.1 peptidylprolyl isomerase [Burkholderia glumae]QGA40711.1 peptidylprolyl isomerase [Burkholderia glumae]QHE13103.1 peptidylprolyl isomerase [Burkholderia glumae AU6208]